MHTITLTDDSFKTLMWLIAAYLCGDIEESESYDSQDEDYLAVQTLEKEINSAPEIRF